LPTPVEIVTLEFHFGLDRGEHMQVIVQLVFATVQEEYEPA